MTAHPSLRHAWEERGRTDPHGAAVHLDTATLSVSQVEHASTALAAAMRDHGVGPGDRVAVCLQNDPQWLITLLAAWRLAAVPVAISPMSPPDEVVRQLEQTGARTLVCLDEVWSRLGQRVGNLLDLVVATHPLDTVPDLQPTSVPLTSLAPPLEVTGARRWRELLQQYDGRTCEPAPLVDDAIGALVHTSGTTGSAKAAVCTHATLARQAEAWARCWSLNSDDVVLCVAPIFHITGLVAGLGAALAAQAPVVLLHRFEAAAVLRAVENWRATFTVGASTAFVALSEHPTLAHHDVSSLTKTASGGAPVSPALVERVRAATGWQLHGAYGMTETSSPTHLTPPGTTAPLHTDSGALAVGLPVPGCEVRIVDPQDGRLLGPGLRGEVVVRGPMVTPGYWERPEETAQLVREGWLHTGDVGVVDEDGWLFVVDRLKDVIIASGFKVLPREVEDVLMAHPAVREAAVIGVPDAYRGETVRAFVSLRPGAEATADELVERCRGQLEPYKVPRHVVFLDELPKNPHGKILKRELRPVHE